MIVRTGVFRGDPSIGVQEVTWGAINQLKLENRKNANLFDELGRLRLLTVEAEAYQENGRFADAARTLAPVWKKLEPRVTAWSKARPLEETGNKSLCRQKLWALLDYVFFYFCRVAGKQAQAVDYFLRLEKIITHELRTSSYTPHGTLALCHYYTGICNNVLSSADSEHHLLEAQKYTYERALRQLSRKGLSIHEREYDEAYKNVFGGRILSGLARLAMQQGHLLTAEHLLYTAQNQHLGTQKSIKRFVSVLQLTVTRRRLPYEHEGYEKAMAALAEYFSGYEARQDPTGQLRCASELARGYLDWAEFGDSSMRELRFRDAERWLNRIAKNAPLETDKLRSELLRARLYLLRGNVFRAKGVINETRSAATPGPWMECGIEISLMEAGFYVQCDPPDYQKAQQIVEKALDIIRANSKGRDQARHDSVLEAECCLLLAKIQLLRGAVASAQTHLNEWSILSQFLDNYYLHHIGKRLQAEIISKSQSYERKFESELYDVANDRVIKTIGECQKDYEMWLRSKLWEHGIRTKGQLARFYGINPSNVDRKPAKPKSKGKKTIS